MSQPRSRDPNEPRVRPKYKTGVSRTGRIYNGKSRKPVKYATIEEANAVKHANGPAYPGADGPSTKMLAIIASGAVLPPRQIAAVRQGIVNVVEQNLERAGKVLANDGEKWSSSQVQLFLGLLHKVAPTMTESLHRHTMQPQDKEYSKLTLAELEAALHDVLDESKVIDVPPDAIEALPEKPKRKKFPSDDPAIIHRRRVKHRLSVKETGARILEKEPTDLPPLTREQDDENRRQAARSAKGLRKKAERNAALNNLKLMAQSDAALAAEKFLKTPPPDPE
jgi:hypothetical protein